MRIQLGYPDYKSERQLLTGEDRHEMVKRIEPVTPTETLKEMQAQVPNIYVSDAILDYVQDIIAGSRSNPNQFLGLSPRAGICLVRAAQAWALSEDRDMVLPEDIQVVAGSVLEHRLAPESSKIKSSGYQAVEQLIRTIPLNQ
jgi:MoxR-like ATPase